MKKKLLSILLVTILLLSSSILVFADKDNNGKDSGGMKYDGARSEEHRKDIASGDKKSSGKIKPGSWADVGKDTHNYLGTDSEGNLYYATGNGNDKDDDEKGSSQPSKPAPPPRPDNEIIIESKDNDTVVWIEREWEFDEGSNSWKPVDYKYQVDLITSANIYDADGKQKNKVTVKAGYGIKVDGSSRFEMKQIAGTKKDSIAGFKQTLPTKGSVTTEFAVKKNIAQDKTLNLESKGKGSFVTAKNSGSKTGAKVVYTDIYQKDGSYNVVVKLYEAKLSGQVLGEHLMSQSNTLSFKIKGSMYEDSYVKPTDSTKNKNKTGFEPITFDNGFEPVKFDNGFN